MHAANSYLHSIGKMAVGSILTFSERSMLDAALREDAKDYYQAALVSFIDGVRSIPSEFFSWATVKMYYSVFYALRSRLAISGECIFYDQSKPRSINTNAGEVVKCRDGNTHKLVMTIFVQKFPNDFFLSQDIDGKPPLSWLLEMREEVNYKKSRFCEPIPPEHMQSAASEGIRILLSSYKVDTVYVFDPDHAILAFPFRMILDLRSRLSRLGMNPMNNSDLEFLRKHAKDKAGKLASLAEIIN